MVKAKAETERGLMKIGDWVGSIWEHGVSCNVNDSAMPMEYTIKDEVGFIIEMDYCNDPRYTIIFPQCLRIMIARMFFIFARAPELSRLLRRLEGGGGEMAWGDPPTLERGPSASTCYVC